MTVAAVIFYLFACTAGASGLFVVLARNPVHSVLWLILTFFSAAGLFVLMGAEFVAMLLIIVYVGAVAGLFLFGIYTGFGKQYRFAAADADAAAAGVARIA